MLVKIKKIPNVVLRIVHSALVKWSIKIYRKKFLLTISIFTLVCVAIFGYLIYYHHSQMNCVVQFHKEYIENQNNAIQEAKRSKNYSISEDVVKYMESEAQTIERMLELQTTQQHSFFTILSLWAGVLMVVFLVFSLYSMFKTDELMRHAHESIKTIEDSKAEVEKKLAEVDGKVEKEIMHIKETSMQFIEEIKKDLQKEQKVVSEGISEKGQEFSKTYKEYEQQLKEAQKTLENILQGVQTVVNAVHNTGTSEAHEQGEEVSTQKSKK